VKPLDPRLLREARAARWFITGVVALATLGVLATVVIAINLTRFITGVFVDGIAPEILAGNLLLVAAAGLTKGAAIWLQELLAVRAAAASRAELRAKYLDAVARAPLSELDAGDGLAARHHLANRGLDALDAYFSRYLPQLVLTSIATPVLGAIIWFSDLTSGIILLCTLPLIPLFMVMIGWATRAVQQRQLDALTRLGQHFLEVLRGLATLKIFGRERVQIATLKDVGEQYRKRTMKVLSVSFLSGFALELGASLAVALMAVTIGFRLLDGTIALSVGLFVLLLAPEAFLPMRNVGANFHAAAEGVLASEAILDEIEREASTKPRGLALPTIEAGKLLVVTGPSGIGKTSLLEALRATLPAHDTAWLPQSGIVFAGSVAENIVGPVEASPCGHDAPRLLDALKMAALDDLELDEPVGESGSAVSGGQRQRIGLARVFLRALDNPRAVLLLDEPVSAIDSARSATIIESLREFAGRGHAVVAVTHQSQLIDAADAIFEVKR
jgi:ATP-binding cassette subfamily C protein CydD